MIDRRTTYRGDVCNAVDFLIVAYANADDAVLGRRTAMAAERLDGVEERWREVLTRRYVYAEPGLQEAMVAFDIVREAAVRAVTHKDEPSILLSRQRLDAARFGVLDAVQLGGQELNEELARQLMPARERLWRALLRRPLVEPAPLPSELGEAAQRASSER
ncbi:hypothetical protein [Modestobacter sp. DSM 44400]|uniref:hypothetical protein n=1 Tax=Modestobacter sp. DSM 44400 TaxID=1550230 RepID=UPI00111538C8|nr:hypothetical protein [Modestobacter sp. DSM 44400]